MKYKYAHRLAQYATTMQSSSYFPVQYWPLTTNHVAWNVRARDWYDKLNFFCSYSFRSFMRKKSHDRIGENKRMHGRDWRESELRSQWENSACFIVCWTDIGRDTWYKFTFDGGIIWHRCNMWKYDGEPQVRNDVEVKEKVQKEREGAFLSVRVTTRHYEGNGG